MTRAPGLVRIGVSVRRGSRFGPLRSWLLAPAVALFVLACVSPAVTVATYAGWDARSETRSPRLSLLYPDAHVVADWAKALDALPSGAPVSIIYLSPTDASSPPPAGLDRWPAAGEVFASPAMTADDEARAVTARYGRPAGTISIAGLVDAGERLLYVNPPPGILDLSGAEPITGFDADRAPVVGAMLDRQPIQYLLVAQIVLLLVPAAWLLWAVLRIGAEARGRRDGVLGLLGGRSDTRRRLLWGEARLPVIGGALLACAGTSMLLLLDVPLPVHTALQAQFMRPAWPMILLALVLGVAVSILASVSRLGLRPRSSRGRPVRTSTLRGVAAPVVAGLTIVACNVLLSQALYAPVLLVFGVGAVATVLLLPTGILTWITTGSRRRHVRAWHRGRAGELVGSAQVAARPRPAARFAATAATAIVVLAVLQSLLSVYDDQAREARALRSAIGDSIAVVNPSDSAPHATEAMAALNRDHAVVQLDFDPSAGTTRLAGTADALQRFGLRPGPVDPAALPEVTAAWLGYLAPLSTIQAVVQEPGTASGELILTPLSGGEVDMAALKSLLAGLTAPAWHADYPGNTWVVGAWVAADQCRWLVLLGAIGVGMLLIALWAGYSDELIRAIRSLSPIQVLAPSGRFAASVLRVRVAVPVLVAVVVGCATALVLAMPVSIAALRPGDLPFALIASTGVLALISGLVAWGVTTGVCVGTSRRVLTGLPEE